MEKKEGFNESVNEQFFAVGKKEQWKTQLDGSQIRLIENKFKSLMKQLNYNLNIINKKYYIDSFDFGKYKFFCNTCLKINTH